MPFSRRGRTAGTVLLVMLVAACRQGTVHSASSSELAAVPWDSILAMGRDSDVTWRMWRGDPSINAYVDGWVAPRLQRMYGIRLRAVSGLGPEIVNQLIMERNAQADGHADLVWVNGETFHNLRSERLLWGPWAHRLPAMALIDSSSSIIMRDFEADPQGYEAPWGRVQFALIYDSARISRPPRTYQELREWIRAHPGRFTHDQQFAGVTFLKGLLYSLSGGPERFQGGFSEDAYRSGSEKVLQWLDELTPSFWRAGRTYPAGTADLHRLFANGEVDFTMSNNHNEVVTKVRQGIFPSSARAVILRDGSIANAHYLGIPFNARNPAGAMLVADFLLSPEAQFQKLQPEVWADGTVLAPERLPEAWRIRFELMEHDALAIAYDTLHRYAAPEIAPQYHTRLAADWRRLIRQNQ